MRRGVNNPSVRVQAKRSRLYGTKLWCVDGPLADRQTEYRGKRFNVRVGTHHGMPLNGEYRRESRPLGNKLGHEVYYQWYGPTPAMVEQAKVAA